MISSVEENAIINDAWSSVNIIRYIRWRGSGLVFRWFWLARAIRGKSQHVNTRRGDEMGSIVMYILVIIENSNGILNHMRLNDAIMELPLMK